MNSLEIRGARAGNLRNVDLDLPLGHWTAIHGPSGAGKSALLFGVLTPIARQRFQLLENPQALPGEDPSLFGEVADSVDGLQPVIALAGEVPRKRKNVTVGEALNLWNFLADVWRREGQRVCVACNHSWSPPKWQDLECTAGAIPLGSKFYISSLAEGEDVEELLLAGWTRVRVHGEWQRVEEATNPLPPNSWLLLDRWKWRKDSLARLKEAANEGFRRLKPFRLEWENQSHDVAAPHQCPQCQILLPDRPLTSLALLREAEDLCIAGKTWTQWGQAPLAEWLQLAKGERYMDYRRLEALEQTRLGHLTATRRLGSLSLGEGRRIELVAFLAQVRKGQLAIFDEPGMGLHGSERLALADLLRRLVVQGNTVLTADPSREFLEAADAWCLLGPGGGPEGGKVVGQGPRPTLPMEEDWPLPPKTKASTHGLKFKNLNHRFLNIPSLEMPLGCLTAICGLSGSGKTTLLEKELIPRLREERDFSGRIPSGGVAVLLERALGHSPFSTLATLSGAWEEIRRAFCEGEEGRIRGLNKSDLVAKLGKGACSECRGYGSRAQGFPCEECFGHGLRRDLLALRLRHRSLQEWLETPLDILDKRLPNDGNLRNRVGHLRDLGLGNRCFGERGKWLSLGERGRIALARSLATSRRSRPKIFILDEPCLGLPVREAVKVVDLLRRLTSEGHSFWVVEHHEVLLRCADYLVEIGPGAGPQGGQLLFTGSASGLEDQLTPTGVWLRERKREAALPGKPTPLAASCSEVLVEDATRKGRHRLEEDLARELATRSPLTQDVDWTPSQESDLHLPPLAWPTSPDPVANLWQVLGFAPAARHQLMQRGRAVCPGCGGKGPWADLLEAAKDTHGMPEGELLFTTPLDALPKGSDGVALLLAAGFRKIWRDNQWLKLDLNSEIHHGDEALLDGFDCCKENDSGRVHDLEHHASLLGQGHLIARRKNRDLPVWTWELGACRQCGKVFESALPTLGGLSLVGLESLPLREALAHLNENGGPEIGKRALKLIHNIPLGVRPGHTFMGDLPFFEQRLIRLLGWLLFPPPGLRLLLDQPLAGQKPGLANQLVKLLSGENGGDFLWTDAEGFGRGTFGKVDMPGAVFLEEELEEANPPLVSLDQTLGEGLGLMAPLREHFLRCELSRMKGWGPADLLTGSALACRECKGRGSHQPHLEIWVDCSRCGGSGWSLGIRGLEDRGLSWSALAGTSLGELASHFQETPRIGGVLALAKDFGMGDWPLGEPLRRLPLGMKALAGATAEWASGAGGKDWVLILADAGWTPLELREIALRMRGYLPSNSFEFWKGRHPALFRP